MGNPEPHRNNENGSKLVKGKLPYQKVLSMGKILNHTPTMGMARKTGVAKDCVM